jgi:hypothetical protein
MPEKTMQEAARELHLAVVALKELIEREYPSRREVERRFISRESSRKRWAVVLAMVVISACLSFVTTVATVSGCFLGDPDHPKICEVLPGYEDTMDRQKRFEEQFKQLGEITKRNDRRLTRLERNQ